MTTQFSALGRRIIVVSGLLLFLGVLINYPVDGTKLLLALGCCAVAMKVPFGWLRAHYVLWILVSAALIVFTVLANEWHFSGVPESLRQSNRWLGIALPWGPLVLLQPGEWVKLAFVLYLAGFFAKRAHLSRHSLKSLLPLGIITSVLCVLAILTPDLSMVVLYGLVIALLLPLTGVRLFWWISVALFAAALFYFFSAARIEFTDLLGPSFAYMDDRIASFVDPWAYPMDQGYQVARSLLAIHRGGWLGQGLGLGERFIPLGQQDFVFSLIAEELGLWVTALVAVAYAVLLRDAFKLAQRYVEHDVFRCYLATTCGLMLFVQAMIHIMVSVNLFPNTGLTLPFVSHGFNSLVVSLIMVLWLIRLDIDWRHVVKSAHLAGPSVARHHG